MSGLSNAASRRLAAGLAAALLTATPAAIAHGFRIGDLEIDHPYAVPSIAGAPNGAAYLRGIRNAGDRPDRLLGAATTVATRVELHRMVLDGDVMRMRAVDAVPLPPRAMTSLRHGGEYHLMLIDLKQPLKDGDRFDLTLRFERAGERAVKVWVQTPRDTTGHRH
jgi:copper(I)-binding protein